MPGAADLRTSLPGFAHSLAVPDTGDLCGCAGPGLETLSLDGYRRPHDASTNTTRPRATR